jgi:hypothetical protein
LGGIDKQGHARWLQHLRRSFDGLPGADLMVGALDGGKGDVAGGQCQLQGWQLNPSETIDRQGLQRGAGQRLGRVEHARVLDRTCQHPTSRATAAQGEPRHAQMDS